MKYMLLMNYYVEGVPPIDQWAPEDVRRHIQFQQDLGAELVASGELVDGQGLAWPDTAKLVRSDGVSAPVVTDGPFAESKEFLAGYWTSTSSTSPRDRDRRDGVGGAETGGAHRCSRCSRLVPLMEAPATCRVTPPPRGPGCANWRRRSSACWSAGRGTWRTRQDALQDALLAATAR